MQMMDIDKLVPHEKNGYFFDDMSGEAWMAFLESIETSGIIEPIVITESSHVIISGHQRVRAAKHFKMKQVPVTFREDKGEDEVLKQLIETNIRQRGIGNTNPVKFGRCLNELDRIYGVRNGSAGGNGSNQYKEVEGHNVSQADLAEQIGISVKQWQRYKSLTTLIPELQDAVQSGQITATTAMGFVKKLSPEEQRQLAEQISGKEKVSNKDVSQYVEQIKATSEENERLRKIVSEKEAENVRLKNQKQEVREVERIVEKVPDDYDALKKKAKQADAYRKDFDNERQKTADERRKNLELQEQLDKLKEQTVLEQNNHDMTASAIMFAMQCRNFIESVGGYVFLSEHLQELPDKEREGYMQSAQAVHDWAQVLLNNIERSTHGILGNSEES